MSSEILNSLLKEYEKKKISAELDLERRKNFLYKKVPHLKEIEDNLNRLAIETSKNIINNKDISLNNLTEKINNFKKEKLEILKSLSLPDNYLTPFYECKICNDTGYIINNNYKTQMCNCLKQKLLNYSFNKSNMSNLKKENFESFNENIFSDDVDLSKYKFNISPRKNILNIKNKCVQFVNNFDNIEQKNLLFTGNTGLR